MYLKLILTPAKTGCSSFVNSFENPIIETTHLFEIFTKYPENKEQFSLRKELAIVQQQVISERVESCKVTMRFSLIFLEGTFEVPLENKCKLREYSVNLFSNFGTRLTHELEFRHTQIMQPTAPNLYMIQPDFELTEGSALISWGTDFNNFYEYKFSAYLRPDLGLKDQDAKGKEICNKKILKNHVKVTETTINKAAWNLLDDKVRFIKIDSELTRSNAGVVILACLEGIIVDKDSGQTTVSIPSFLLTQLSPAGVRGLSVFTLQDSAINLGGESLQDQKGFRLQFNHPLPCSSVFEVNFQVEHGRVLQEKDQIPLFEIHKRSEAPSNLILASAFCDISELDDSETGENVGREISLTTLDLQNQVDPGFYFISINTKNVLNFRTGNLLDSKIKSNRIAVYEDKQDNDVIISDSGSGVIQVTSKVHKFCDYIEFSVENLDLPKHPNFPDTKVISWNDYEKLQYFKLNKNFEENDCLYSNGTMIRNDFCESLELENQYKYQGKLNAIPKLDRFKTYQKKCTKFNKLIDEYPKNSMEILIKDNIYFVQYRLRSA